MVKRKAAAGALSAGVSGVASAIAAAAVAAAQSSIGDTAVLLCAIVGAVCGLAGYLYGYADGASAKSTAASLPRPRRSAISGFSRMKARAVRAALDSDGQIAPGKYSNVVLLSIANREGIFEAAAIGYGAPQMIESFGITERWRSFLSKPGNRELLEDACKRA